MKIWALLICTLTLCGCSMFSIPGLTTPERPKTIYQWNETQTKEPILSVQNAKGESVVAYKTTNEIKANLDQGPVALTFMQKLGRAVGNLSIWAIIALLVGVLGFPSVVIPWLLAQVGKYKKALSQTVKAIDQAPPGTKDALKPVLSDKQDTDTKALIGEMKAKM